MRVDLSEEERIYLENLFSSGLGKKVEIVGVDVPEEYHNQNKTKSKEEK